LLLAAANTAHGTQVQVAGGRFDGNSSYRRALNPKGPRSRGRWCKRTDDDELLLDVVVVVEVDVEVLVLVLVLVVEDVELVVVELVEVDVEVDVTVEELVVVVVLLLVLVVEVVEVDVLCGQKWEKSQRKRPSGQQQGCGASSSSP